MLVVRVFKVYELQGGVSSFPFNLVGVDFNFKLLIPTPKKTEYSISWLSWGHLDICAAYMFYLRLD